MSWRQRAAQIRSSFTGTWSTWWGEAQRLARTMAPDVVRWRRELTTVYAQLVTAVQVVAATRVLLQRLPPDRRARHEAAQGALEEETRRLSALVWGDVEVELPGGVGAVPVIAVGIGALAVVGLAGLYVAREYVPVYLREAEAQLRRVKLEAEELRAREAASREGRRLQDSTLPAHPVPPADPLVTAGRVVGGLVVLGGLAVAGVWLRRTAWIR